MAMTLSVACLFVHLGLSFGTLDRNHNYGIDTNLQDHVCQHNDVVFNVKLASTLICAAKCAQTSDCRSHMYNSVGKDCIGCREKYKKVGQMTSDAGFKYYGNATNNYHDECDVDTDCNEPDTICEPGSKICVCTPGYSFNPSTKSCVTKNYHKRCDVTVDCNEFETICESGSKICVCTPGYSFQSSTNTCVSSCSTYGNTYEVYTNMYMEGHNLATKTGTLQVCKDFCSSKGNCLSFEREGDTCWTSGASALTHPGSYKPWNNCNYYNRNCA